MTTSILVYIAKAAASHLIPSLLRKMQHHPSARDADLHDHPHVHRLTRVLSLANISTCIGVFLSLTDKDSEISSVAKTSLKITNQPKCNALAVISGFCQDVTCRNHRN